MVFPLFPGAARHGVLRCRPGIVPTGSELHAGRLLELGAAFTEIEERTLAEAKDRGKERRRELLDARVVLLHRVVEEAARGSELVLDVGKLALQLLEVRVGLKVGIALGERE